MFNKVDIFYLEFLLFSCEVCTESKQFTFEDGIESRINGSSFVFLSGQGPFSILYFNPQKNDVEKSFLLVFHLRKSNLSDFFSAYSGLSIEANYQIFEITVDFWKRF